MKGKLIALIMITSTLLAGCKDKVYEDKRMGDANERAMKVEYNIYARNITDSGYNWYSDYIDSFVEPLNENGYKVEPSLVEKQIEKVEEKKNEVSNINSEKVKKALDKIALDISKKEKNDKSFSDGITSSKNKIDRNKKLMESMLDSIEDSLKLGMDGSYSNEDLSKIKNTQINLIKIYDEKLRDNN